MFNFETDSNCSYRSDSLASTISGLSAYQNEFAELRHLVNPSKYPTPVLDRSSTPKAELFSIETDEAINTLKNELQNSLELNQQYKRQIDDLERKIELSFHDKVEKLLRNNSRLEGQLENANSQIERLIRNYREKNNYVVFKEKIDLEKKVHDVGFENISLKKQAAVLNEEKGKLNFENKSLKIALGELAIEQDIKNGSIQSLKEKISHQHVEAQNCFKNNNILIEKNNNLSLQLQQSERSINWYKEQLRSCQNQKNTLTEELLENKRRVVNLNDTVSSLNLELSKSRSEVDNVRLQVLREKEELFQKLQTVNLNEFDCEKDCVVNTSSLAEETVCLSYYELTIQDLKDEIVRVRENVQENDDNFERIKQENSNLMSQCLVLQKTLQQKETNIELLENSKKELVRKLEYLKEGEKKKLCEILQLKNKVVELQVEVHTNKEEKCIVDDTVKVVRKQFLMFKENYEKIKSEVNLKNKEILQLQTEKQELFMNNNWTICELEKTKEKDIVIDSLKKNISSLEEKITILTQKIKSLEFDLLKKDRIIDQKENNVKDKLKELESYDTVIFQYKNLVSDFENKLNNSQLALRDAKTKQIDAEENFKIVKIELKKKDVKLDNALKNLEQLQSNLLESNRIFEQKFESEMKNKEGYIEKLREKLEKLEKNYKIYLEKNTDDKKVELLLNKTQYKNNNTQINANIFKIPLSDSKNLKNLESMANGDNNFESVLLESTFGQFDITGMENIVGVKLAKFEEKIKIMNTICDDFKKKMNKNQCNVEKIKELEVLLQVKDRDSVEKQKKFDRNNRTLLRKVKEHMKGRNTAEKHLKYLQDLYNTLSDDHNTLKLSFNTKSLEVESLQQLCETYKNESEKLKLTVLSLEKEASRNLTCDKCLDLDNLKEKIEYVEKVCKVYEERSRKIEGELKVSEENVLKLEMKNKELDMINTSAKEDVQKVLKENHENKKTLNVLKERELEFLEHTVLMENLKDELKQKDDICNKNISFNRDLQDELNQAKEKNNVLSEEVKILSLNLQQKVEHLQSTEESKSNLEKELGQKEIHCNKIIDGLKNHLRASQNELNRLNSHKQFSQRLCNDLKVALRSYVENNKILKQQLTNYTNEQPTFKSLPLTLSDGTGITGKYDEKYICQLLEANRAPSVKNPLTNDIRECLEKLREEILSLQDQIAKKNNGAPVV